MGPSRLAVAVLAFLLDAGFVDPGGAGQGGEGGYARALELFGKGRLAEAARVCEAGMRQDSGNHRFTYLLGRIFFTQAQELEKKQRNDPEAAELFQRAKRMLLAAEAASPGPLDSGLDHAVGSILLREQRPDAAIERFSRAIAKAPGNGTFHRLRGHTFLQLGDYEPARRDLRAAVDLEPENHSGRIWLAEAQYLGGRIEGARESLWEYHGLLEGSPADPRHSHVLYKIFEYALAANALEEARRALEMGLALREEDPLLLVELGVLLYRLGEFGRSAEVLERLLARGTKPNPGTAPRRTGTAGSQRSSWATTPSPGSISRRRWRSPPGTPRRCGRWPFRSAASATGRARARPPTASRRCCPLNSGRRSSGNGSPSIRATTPPAPS